MVNIAYSVVGLWVCVGGYGARQVLPRSTRVVLSRWWMYSSTVPRLYVCNDVTPTVSHQQHAQMTSSALICGGFEASEHGESGEHQRGTWSKSLCSISRTSRCLPINFHAVRRSQWYQTLIRRQEADQGPTLRPVFSQLSPAATLPFQPTNWIL